MFMSILGCGLKWGSIADFGTAFFALCAFGFSLYEFCKYKKRERVGILTQMNIRYTTDSDINAVVRYLEALEDKKENALALPNIHQLEMFMRFSEELCCLVRSNALKVNIVYYMFGHYVLVFANYKDKWPIELGYEKGYWRLFRDFVNKMQEAHDELYPYIDDNNNTNEYNINVKKIKL